MVYYFVGFFVVLAAGFGVTDLAATLALAAGLEAAAFIFGVSL